jgi:hypothetical protein
VGRFEGKPVGAVKTRANPDIAFQRVRDVGPVL